MCYYIIEHNQLGLTCYLILEMRTLKLETSPNFIGSQFYQFIKKCTKISLKNGEHN